MRKPEIQKLAFQFALANGLTGFSEGKGQAGHYWFKAFMKRHCRLGLRKPEALSAARAACFNPVVVGQWFKTYEDIITDLGIQDVPSHLWNCDETGLQDHFVSSRVVSPVGSPCFEVTANEQGRTTTLLASLNAAGEYGPLMVIFKAKRLRSEWCYGAPTNTLVKATETGWINKEVFLDWGKQFIASLQKDDPHPHYYYWMGTALTFLIWN